MRTVYLDSVRNDPLTVAHADWLANGAAAYARAFAAEPL